MSLTIIRSHSQPLIFAGGLEIGPVVGEGVGWWQAVTGVTPIVAYDPKNAASLAASYVNLANPGTYNATLGVAPNWAAGTGWTGNALSMYLRTGFTPTGGLFTMVIRFSGAGTNQLIAGCRAAGVNSRFGLMPRNLADTSVGIYYGNNLDFRVPSLAAGVLALDGANQLLYRNGAVDGAAFGNAWTDPAVELYVLAYNTSGVAGSFFGGTIAAFWLCAGGLTAPQHLTLATAMAAL